MIKTFSLFTNTRARFITIAAISFIIILLLIAYGIFNQNGTLNSNSNADTFSKNTHNDKIQSVVYGSTDYVFNSFLSNSNNTDGISDIEATDIYDMLEYTLNLNGITDHVSDITIRDGTYSRELINTNKLIYQTTFMLDIPSIQQSYYVRNLYSPLPVEQSGLYDYNTVVLCPNDDQLIYAPFDCIDRVRYEINGAS